jgi:hypothetical protein
VASIVESLRTILINDPDVAELVGTRIMADHLPQSYPTPAIVFWIRREQSLDAIDGCLGMDQPTFRVACYSNSRLESDRLRQAVRGAFCGFTGVVGGLYIKGIAQELWRGRDHTSDRVSSGTDQYRFITAQDFRITYDVAEVN